MVLSKVTIIPMHKRPLVFALVWLILAWSLHGQDMDLKARSMSKDYLPIGFPTEILDAGFAVIELTIINKGESSMEVSPDRVLTWSPKRKRLSRIQPSKMLPKMMKFYRGRSGIDGDIYTGSNLPPPPGGNPGDATAGSMARSYSAVALQQLRVILNGYQLKKGSLAGGESIQGYIFVKSKKRGAQLSGGKVAMDQISTVIE